MNLRDRMNSGLQSSEQTESGKKPSTSDITEKSNQQPKESVMQSQSETIQRQAQEIRLLSSENSILKKKLQEQSGKIVSLNEQIGKLSGADLVLKQNEELANRNSELMKSASDAEAKAEAVKAEYARKEDSLRSKLADAEKLEHDARRKNDEMDKRISDLADERIADAKRKLEQSSRHDRDQARRQYLELGQRCKNDYEAKTAADEGFMWGCLLFAILATVFTGIKSPRFSHDVIEAVTAIGKFFGGLGAASWDLSRDAWSLHTQLSTPVIQVIIPAVLTGLSLVAPTGLAAGFFGFIGYKFVCFYREHFADRTSIYVAITELAVIVWFADGMAFVKVNMIVLFITVHLIYIFIRMVITREGNELYSGW